MNCFCVDVYDYRFVWLMGNKVLDGCLELYISNFNWLFGSFFIDKRG